MKLCEVEKICIRVGLTLHILLRIYNLVTAASTSNMISTSKPRKLIGFERGLEPEEILAATDKPGITLFKFIEILC